MPERDIRWIQAGDVLPQMDAIAEDTNDRDDAEDLTSGGLQL